MSEPQTISREELHSLQWKRPKYGNRKTLREGIWFDSGVEADRFTELKVLEAMGEITHLELQPRFDIRMKGQYCGYYKADFAYLSKNNHVVEDVKSPSTAKNTTYRLKKKLVEAQYSVEIVEIIRKTRAA